MASKLCQSPKRAWSGRRCEKALSRLRSRLSRDRQSANSEKSYKRIPLISLWRPVEKHPQLAVLLNPRPPSELSPSLPASIRQSCRRRGGPCLARPSYHSAGARDGENRITWRCATKRPVSGLLRAASLTIFLGAGEVNGRAGVEGWKPAGRSRASLDRGQRSLGSGWTYAS